MEHSVHLEMIEQNHGHWWFLARRRVLRAVLQALDLPKPCRILEAGCGVGGNLALLGEFGTVQAFEYDAFATHIAQALKLAEVKPGALPDGIPYPPASFDLVVALDVLEHVSPDAEAVQALAAMLAPGGRLLLTVPAYQWMFSAHDRAHHHHRRYRASRLRLFCEAAGLEVQRAGYYNALLFPLIAAARLGSLALRQDSADTGASDARTPPKPVNRLLEGIFASERHVVRHTGFPFGTSVLLVARRAR